MSAPFRLQPLRRALAALFITSACAATAANAAIVVDGQTSDWSALPVLAQATGQAAQTLQMTTQDGYLLVLVTGQGFSGNYNLFLNTDGDASTGYQSAAWPQGSGADFLLSNGVLYRSTGSGWSWVQAAGEVQVSSSATTLEVKIALSALGLPVRSAKLSAGFQALTTDWQTQAVLPTATSLASFTASALLGTAKGMIIPAYLPLTDSADWNVLKEGAAVMAAGTNPAYRDYWITVNSSTNGPFTSAADWSTAATLWNPIRANGGKIIGYVHTCTTPTGPYFRPLATVEGEIAAWVQGYPQLDGIWLDEFYPRFEIAAADGATGPTYPNGVADAPTDRGFVNSANQFNGQQVVPAGGYYDQLVSWIHANYPNLVIVGNAGGAFYSNQLAYANLPDVLVSFEQNFDTAADAPVDDWSGLNRQVPDSQSGQLALIHRNTSALAAAVDEALAHGYTHVYTTDRLLEDNVWGGLPPYLTSEIQYIADHP